MCPHRTHQAPGGLNEAVDIRCEQDARSPQRNKVKSRSVGQGNDETQVKMWKAFQKVPFPVIPDPNSQPGQGPEFHPLSGLHARG